MAQFTVTSRHGDCKFESNHPNVKALWTRLNVLISREEIVNDHAIRLRDGYIKFGGWKDYHEAWAAFHVAKHDHPDRFLGGNRVLQGLASIVQHLIGCKLKNPCITLLQEGQTVAIKVCGSRSKFPGSLSIAQSPKYGEGAFYGYINPTGTFEPRPNTPDAVVKILQRVAEDPARVISDIGRQSGLCCYCNHPLTQVQSKIAGAGKTCCQNYGIEWPNASRTRTILLDCPEFLVGASDEDRWVGTPRPLLDAVMES